MTPQETLESTTPYEFDEPEGLKMTRRKGPLEGPIKQILESQDRMEANVATLTAMMRLLQLKWEPDTPIARWCWRHRL